ncbi:MAG: DUF1573 domain-containing protein [Flavobacteriaceae bacterium]|jgi:hypothetical protein|nr:DUF1573 domain-containing protein [Flavobacteriaceae bacterium]
MKQIIYISSVLMFLCVFTGCNRTTQQKTLVEIVDNNRHYYPVQQGEEKTMVFALVNKGEHPFVLSDMLVSCGCIVVKKASIQHIPAGGEGKLVVKFDTTKNIGYVKHYITLYGNLMEKESIEVIFDLNIVPDAHYTKDYEELYKEYKGDTAKDLVDGLIDRDYYLDKKME